MWRRRRKINFLFFLVFRTIERKGDGMGVGGEKIKSWKVEEKKKVGEMMNIHMNEGKRRNEGQNENKRRRKWG